MAILTASRSDRDGRPAPMEQLGFEPIASTSYWRGGAVLHRLSGTDEGALSRVLDGTIHGVFAGVVIREEVAPASPVLKDYVPLKRAGSVQFPSLSALWTLDTDVGKLAWFVDDNNVSPTPPSADYPVCAGRVIKTVSTSLVEVDITQAVGRMVNWQELVIGPLDVTALSTSQIEVLTDYLFDRRIFMREVTSVNVVAPDASIDDSLVEKDATFIGTDPLTGTGTTLGAIVTNALNTVFEPTETLTLIMGADSAVTAGSVAFIFRYMNID